MLNIYFEMSLSTSCLSEFDRAFVQAIFKALEEETQAFRGIHLHTLLLWVDLLLVDIHLEKQDCVFHP
jgi:hypothetical protein